MPKIDNIHQVVQTFLNRTVVFPKIAGLGEDFSKIKLDLVNIIEQSPAETPEMGLKEQSMFLLPGVNVCDLTYIFNTNLSRRYYELAHRKSNQVFFLAAYFMKSDDLRSLLFEFKSKFEQIAKLEKELQSHSTSTDRKVKIHFDLQCFRQYTNSLVLRDAHGRHIVQYAALGGNFDTLKYLLAMPEVLTSISDEDQKAIMACAVASQSERCVHYLKCSFKSDDNRLLTRDQIVQQFKTLDDAELYQFIKNYPPYETSSGKFVGVFGAFYIAGGEQNHCLEILKRLEQLEISPLMLKKEYDVRDVIQCIDEFKNQVFVDYSSAKGNVHLQKELHEFYNKIHGSPFTTQLMANTVNEGHVAKIHALINRDRAQYSQNITSFASNALLRLHFSVVDYFIKSQLITVKELGQIYSLHRACANQDLEIVRYYLEKCGMSPTPFYSESNYSLPWQTALNPPDNPVLPYLLNRVDFLQCRDDEVYEHCRIDKFEYSETGIANLCKLEPDALPKYLSFMHKKLRTDKPLAGINLAKCNASLQFLFLQKLLASKEQLHINEKLRGYRFELSGDLYLHNQLEGIAVTAILSNQHLLTPEDAQNFAKYKEELATKHQAWLSEFTDPTATDNQRTKALAKINEAKEFGHLGAAEIYLQSQRHEAIRLIQLNSVEHINKLDEMAKEGIAEAKQFIDQRNNRLAVEMRNDALKKKENVHEESLRKLAITHPYAKLQLAILQIERYQQSFKLFNGALAEEANKLLNDEQIANFPETFYYKGVCQSQGIGQKPDAILALHSYYLAAREGCSIATETLTSFHKVKTERSEISCRANIYSAVLSMSNKPAGYYSAFEHIAEQFRAHYVKCMVSIAQKIEDPDHLLLKMAFKYANTFIEKEFVETACRLMCPGKNIAELPQITVQSASTNSTAPEPTVGPTLQDRLNKVDPDAVIPEHLQDSLFYHLVNDPGVSDDGQLYDKKTFDMIKGKRSPIDENIEIKNFQRVRVIRKQAIEFVEAAERKAKATAVQSTATLFNPAPSAPVLFDEPKPSAPECIDDDNPYPSVEQHDDVALGLGVVHDGELVAEVTRVAELRS